MFHEGSFVACSGGQHLWLLVAGDVVAVVAVNGQSTTVFVDQQPKCRHLEAGTLISCLTTQPQNQGSSSWWLLLPPPSANHSGTSVVDGGCLRWGSYAPTSPKPEIPVANGEDDGWLLRWRLYVADTWIRTR